MFSKPSKIVNLGVLLSVVSFLLGLIFCVLHSVASKLAWILLACVIGVPAVLCLLFTFIFCLALFVVNPLVAFALMGYYYGKKLIR